MTDAFSSSVPAGRIVSTSPVAGASVPPGTAVDCVKSKGVELVVVPDVVGESVSEALADITGAGLVPGTRTDTFHATIAAGLVISTQPAAGASVAPSTAVAYVVSMGPPPPPVEYIGAATAASTAAATYPAGTQAGDLVVAVATRWAAANASLIGGPATGFTKSRVDAVNRWQGMCPARREHLLPDHRCVLPRGHGG